MRWREPFSNGYLFLLCVTSHSDVIHYARQSLVTGIYTLNIICFEMSNSSIVNKIDSVSSGNDSVLPVQVTVLQAADIPKASAEALQLLKSIG